MKRYFKTTLSIKFKRIIPLALICGCAIWASAFDSPEREKAKYYFLQGSIEASSKNMGSAYEYIKKAASLDSSYSEAAFTLGGQRIFVQTDTLQSDFELKRSLAMMQNYVDKFPADLYASQLYGFVSSRLDTVQEAIRVYQRAYDLMPSETQLLNALADAYIMSRKPGDAIETLEKYEKIEGKNPAVTLKKISCMLADGDTISAVSEVETLVHLQPRDFYSRLLKGNLYEIIGNKDSVLSAYKQAELLAPENGAVKMSLANYYRAQGDSVMLDNTIYEALLSEDFEVEEKVSILGEYLQKLIDDKGEKSRGDHLFSVLMEQYPHEPSLLDMSARYSAAKGNFAEAAEEIEYAIDLDATNQAYWTMLLRFLLADEKYEEAVKKYQEALLHITPDETLKNLYAMAASLLSDYHGGEAIIISLIEDAGVKDPWSDSETLSNIRKSLNYDQILWLSNLYCMLGDLYYKGGDQENGFKAYDNSLLFYPDNALTLNNYAYFLAEEGKDLDKAKQMSRRSLDLSDNNPTYLDTYAWILYKLGEYQEALECQQLAIELAGEEDLNPEFTEHLDAIKKKIDNPGADNISK